MDENVNEPTESPESEPTENTEPEPVVESGEPAESQPEAAALPSQDSRNMAMLCHLLGLLTCFVGPLILWLIKKDEDEFVNRQGKEALNFQITVLLASIVSGLLTMVCIGFVLAIVVGVADLVFSIMACVKSSKGEDYRYPVALRLIK